MLQTFKQIAVSEVSSWNVGVVEASSRDFQNHCSTSSFGFSEIHQRLKEKNKVEEPQALVVLSSI